MQKQTETVSYRISDVVLDKFYNYFTLFHDYLSHGRTSKEKLEDFTFFGMLFILSVTAVYVVVKIISPTLPFI